MISKDQISRMLAKEIRYFMFEYSDHRSDYLEAKNDIAKQSKAEVEMRRIRDSIDDFAEDFVDNLVAKCKETYRSDW